MPTHPASALRSIQPLDKEGVPNEERRPPVFKIPKNTAKVTPKSKSLKKGTHKVHSPEMGLAKKIKGLLEKLPTQERRELLLSLAHEYGITLAGNTSDSKDNSSNTAKPRLIWFKDRHKGETAPDFIFRAYAAEREAGTLHRGLIRNQDRPLYRALYKWEGVEGNKLTFDIPSEPEWNTQQLAKMDDNPLAREVVRLLNVRRTRERSAKIAHPS